jgi:hypothetical protein
MTQRSPGEDRGEQLVERLRAVRRELETAPTRARREALDKELAAQIQGLTAPERGALLERALGVLRPASGGDAQADQDFKRRLTELKQKHDAAVAAGEAIARERDAAVATRDALLGRIASLEAELASKAAEPQGGGAGMEAFRAGLKTAIEGKKIDPKALGLASADVRLFRLTHELVNFVYMLELGRVTFLNELQVGPMLGTVLMKDFQQQVRKRVKAVLNDEAGSVKAFQEILKQLNAFVTGLPASFQESFPTGTKALLAELDPEPILEKAKRFLTDYEKAWNAFVQTRSDLTNLTKDELWERYFKPPFQQEIGKWTGGKR